MIKCGVSVTTAVKICLIGLATAVSITPLLVVAIRRHRRDLRCYLEPVLRDAGVQFVSAVHPGLFKVGPFPWFEMEVGRPWSVVAGVKGEYCQYRIVTIIDSQGQPHTLWAQVESELFRLRRVRWRAERKESLPANVISILEN